MSVLSSQSLKCKMFSCAAERVINKSVTRKVKVLKRFKKINSVDESIAKDFLYEKGDVSHFLDPENDEFEKLGYVRIAGFSERSIKVKVLGIELKNEIEQKNGMERQRLDVQRNGLETGLAVKDKKIISKEEFQDQRLEKTQRIKEEQLNRMRIKELGAQRERSIKRFDLIKGKWNQIENGLVRKLKKRRAELLNNKKKSEFEKISSKMPSWRISLRSDPSENNFFEFIPVGNKFSGIFVRDKVSKSTLRISRSKVSIT